MSDALDHMAKRCETDPDGFFLAGPLALHRDRLQWTDADLAEWLGITAEELTRLKLCRLPASDWDLLVVTAAMGARCRVRLREVLGM